MIAHVSFAPGLHTISFIPVSYLVFLNQSVVLKISFKFATLDPTDQPLKVSLFDYKV